MALGYVLSKSYIDKIVIGVDSVVQLKSNINASKTQLNDSIIRKIDSIITKDKNLLNPINW
jgi:aryl-alcohol dehydrogenase-like predicted oxidoreductase